MNTYLRDNLLETMPAKATDYTSWFTSSSPNSIDQRGIETETEADAVTTSSTSFVSLSGGPAVTVNTGTSALIIFAAGMENNTADRECQMAVRVTGATNIPASDVYALLSDGRQAGNLARFFNFRLENNLTAGANQFECQYAVGSGTGTWRDRTLTVIAL